MNDLPDTSPPRSDRGGSWRNRSNALHRGLPLAAVIATSVGSLVALRAQATRVPYTNDSAVAEEMVVAALRAIRAGHFPPSTWFSYLNLGSPQFLHYQPLAAMVTAFLAWGVGAGHAVALTTWVLVSCWPLCLYGAARILGLRRTAAAVTAVLSPFVSSATGVGYEQISYLFAGYGVWSQLFAMWTLPLAWACSWRAVEERRFVLPAAVLVAATAAFHFETGYLAFAGILVCIAVRPTHPERAFRGLVVAGSAIALDAWTIVPLIAQGKWAAINSFLQSGPDANSYGATQVLTWLVDGGLFDWHHALLLTPLVAIGLIACSARRWGTWELRTVPEGVARLLVGLFLVSLVLFFGRTTLGPVLDLLPGSKNLFLRRFLVGVQLSGLFLAGIGATELAIEFASRCSSALAQDPYRRVRGTRAVPGAILVCVAATLLVPAWSFVVEQADGNAFYIREQVAASPSERDVDALVAQVQLHGGGRVFAGDPSDDWGSAFTVGLVPVFKYLASKEVDEVGFTLRTASLMSGPEVAFDETNPADYAAFGIRWLIVPAERTPPVQATLVEQRGRYALWTLANSGYFQVVDTSGAVTASSASLAAFATTFLTSLPEEEPRYPTIAYADGRAAPATLPLGRPASTPAGTVIAQRVELADGEAAATVVANREAVVLLSASYDPGWQVEVDGHAAHTEMVAPALVGVRVDAGRHVVRFTYRGFPDYPQLLGLGLAALAVLVWLELRTRARRVARGR